MWLKKMKKKKMQFLIIALILLMANAILVACISFAWETNKFVDKYYSSDNCPMYFDVLSQDNGKELLENDPQIMQYIDKIDTSNAKYVEASFMKGKKKLQDNACFVYEVEDLAKLGYDLKIIDGENANRPGDGEIWICHIYAKEYHLSVGDKIRIGKQNGKTYTVSAIVNTPQCCSGFLNNYPFYMNKKMLGQLEGTNAYAVRFYSKNDEVSIKQIVDHLPKEYANEVLTSLDRYTFKLCLSILTTMFGSVGIIAALIIFAVSLIVIRYMIRAAINKEYRMIGIYKALGKTGKEVKRIYYNCYMSAGIVGILIGLFLGKPLAVFLVNMVLDGIEGFHLTQVSNLIGIGASVLMIGILALNIGLELRKIGKITPIQAMSVGNTSSKEKLCKSVIPNAHSAAAMAVNGIFKKKGMNILVVLILTVSFYLCLVSCSIALTLNHYSDDNRIWDNLPEYDGEIKLIGDENVEEYLKSSPYVKDYVTMSLGLECSQMTFEGSDLTEDESNPMVYSNFTLDRYKNVPFTKGRICVNPHEIACSKKFLNRVNKSVGDYLKISVGDKSIDFLISGSYSAMIQGGTSFYIKEEDLDELGVSYSPSTALLFLKDGATYEQFASDFDSHFEKSKLYPQFDFITTEGDTVAQIANPICVVIFGAFFAFSILNIINLVYTLNRENRRKYGILKANGFTTRYIKSEVMIRMAMEAGVAVVVSIIAHEFLSPLLFALACGVNYVRKPVWLTASVCCGIFVIILMITFVMLLPIKKISPVELMEE